MGMKYVSAYLMAVLGGKEEPSAKDIEKILASVGSECDSAIAEKLVSEIKSKGKPVHEMIAEGKEQLKGFGGGGGGGGGAAAPAAGGASGGGAAAPAAAVVEEVEEEDMEFDLFD